MFKLELMEKFRITSPASLAEDSCPELTQTCGMREKVELRETAPRLSATEIKQAAVKFQIEAILNSNVSPDEFLKALFDIIRVCDPNFHGKLVDNLYVNGELLDTLTFIWDKMPDNIKVLEIISVIKELANKEEGLSHLLTITFECFGSYDKRLKHLPVETIFLLTTIANLCKLLESHADYPKLIRYLYETMGLVEVQK